MLDVFSVFIGGVSVHLDSEGHPFLPAVLPGGELGADAVDLKGQENREELKNKFSLRPQLPPSQELRLESNMYLDENRSVLQGIPEELDGVEMQRV